MFLSMTDSVMNSHIYLRDVLLQLKLYGEFSLLSNTCSTRSEHSTKLSHISYSFK